MEDDFFFDDGLADFESFLLNFDDSVSLADSCDYSDAFQTPDPQFDPASSPRAAEHRAAPPATDPRPPYHTARIRGFLDEKSRIPFVDKPQVDSRAPEVGDAVAPTQPSSPVWCFPPPGPDDDFDQLSNNIHDFIVLIQLRGPESAKVFKLGVIVPSSAPYESSVVAHPDGTHGIYNLRATVFYIFDAVSCTWVMWDVSNPLCTARTKHFYAGYAPLQLQVRYSDLPEPGSVPKSPTPPPTSNPAYTLHGSVCTPFGYDRRHGFPPFVAIDLRVSLYYPPDSPILPRMDRAQARQRTASAIIGMLKADYRTACSALPCLPPTLKQPDALDAHLSGKDFDTKFFSLQHHLMMLSCLGYRPGAPDGDDSFSDSDSDRRRPPQKRKPLGPAGPGREKPAKKHKPLEPVDPPGPDKSAKKREPLEPVDPGRERPPQKRELVEPVDPDRDRPAKKHKPLEPADPPDLDKPAKKRKQARRSASRPQGQSTQPVDGDSTDIL